MKLKRVKILTYNLFLRPPPIAGEGGDFKVGSLYRSFVIIVITISSKSFPSRCFCFLFFSFLFVHFLPPKITSRTLHQTTRGQDQRCEDFCRLLAQENWDIVCLQEVHTSPYFLHYNCTPNHSVQCPYSRRSNLPAA